MGSTERSLLGRRSGRQDRYFPTSTAGVLALVSLSLPLVALGAAEAQQLPPALPRQPLQELFRTETVYPQEKGEVQLTFSPTADRARDGSMLAFPMQAEFGLTDAWQVEVEWRSYSRVRAGDVVSSGLGGYSIGTKYSFMNVGGSSLHAAVGIELEFSGGLTSAGSIEHDREAEPFIALAFDLRSRAQVFLHTGRTFTVSSSDLDDAKSVTADDDGDEEGSVQWNAGALMAFSRLTLAMELSLVNDGFPWQAGGERYFTPSITVPIGASWEVGVGLPLGLNRRADRFGVAALAIFER